MTKEFSRKSNRMLAGIRHDSNRVSGAHCSEERLTSTEVSQPWRFEPAQPGHTVDAHSLRAR